MKTSPLRLFTSAALAAGLALAAPLAAQLPRDMVNGGGVYKDGPQKAADCYSRGAKALEAAEKLAAAGDAEKARKKYERAKSEFQKAVGFQEGYFEALLGLGRSQLALGNRESALDACRHAVAIRPGNELAQQCVLDASQASTAAAAGGQ